jgi:hypothetical protein
MCRFTHQLAGTGTMSWPHSGVQRPRRRYSADLPGPIWKHMMAATASLKASVGRDGRKLLRLQLTFAHRVINWHQPAGLRGKKTITRNPDCTAICVGSAFAIDIKQFRQWQASLINRFCTVRNHPMAAHFLEASAGQNGHRMGGVTSSCE